MRIVLLIGAVCGFAAAADFPAIHLVKVAGGLRNITEITHAGDDRLFIVERQGRIRILKSGAVLPVPFLDITMRVKSTEGEQGLLGLAFPPDFANKRYFYVNYTNPNGPAGNTIISRFNLSADADRADPNSEKVLLTIVQPYANHNGGKLAFGPKDGYLYVGMGDGGSGGDPQNNAQNGSSLLGKMLRIDTESGTSPYGIPQSNPFINRSGFRPEIWATGVRNPWRFSFDRETHDLWIGDVGQDRAEEIDFQPASSSGGENYGWRLMEGLQCFNPSSCDRTNLVLPVTEYTHADGCSVTGGYVYRGSRFTALRGIYLYADFCNGNIWGVQREGNGWMNQRMLQSRLAISTFGEDVNGEIYIGHFDGDVYLVAAGTPAFTANAVVNAASFAEGITPGSIATVFGAGLTTLPGIIQAERTPLPNELSGVAITVNGQPAPIFAVANVNGQEQINFQVPWEARTSERATIVVTTGGQRSSAITVSVRQMQPGVFTLGTNKAGAITDASGGILSRLSPAQRGQGITIYATGLGSVNNAPATGAAAPAAPLFTTTATPAVTIGGLNATVQFSGLTPTYVGLYQLNATVPPNASTGEQDLVVTINGVSSPPVKIWIR